MKENCEIMSKPARQEGTPAQEARGRKPRIGLVSRIAKGLRKMVCTSCESRPVPLLHVAKSCIDELEALGREIPSLVMSPHNLEMSTSIFLTMVGDSLQEQEEQLLIKELTDPAVVLPAVCLVSDSIHPQGEQCVLNVYLYRDYSCPHCLTKECACKYLKAQEANRVPVVIFEH